MNRMKYRWLAVGAVTAVLGVLASVHVASAQGGFGHLVRGGADRGALLAEALGITVDELQAAQDKAFEAGLATAVEAGEIEQADADLILARKRLQRTMDHEAIMTEALGVTADDLAAAREDGKTLRDLMADQNVDAAALREKLTAAHEAALDKAVADGLITREQADRMGEMHGAMDCGMGGDGMHGMRGMHGLGQGGHGMRGMHGMHGLGQGGHGMGSHGMGSHRGHQGYGGPLMPEHGGAGIGEPDPAEMGGHMGMGEHMGAPLGGQDL